MRKIVIYLVFLIVSGWSFGQGASLSPYDLKESYLEKKASFKSYGTKAISETNQAELDRIVSILAENAPASFEFHLVKYLNGNYDLSLKNDLFKAYELRPDDRLVLQEMFGYYVLTGDLVKQKEFAQKLYAGYPVGEMNYYRELLNQETATYLIFSGEKDAYPALVSTVLGKSKKIKIINLDFLFNEKYRKSIQAEIGGVNMKFLGNESGFIAALLASKTASVHVSTTVSQRYLRDVSDQMYLVGLSYAFNAGNQQQAELEKFWTKSQSFLVNTNPNSRAEKALFANYLPPLLTLYKIKITVGEKDPALRKGIVLLAQKLGKTEVVDEILKAYEQNE